MVLDTVYVIATDDELFVFDTLKTALAAVALTYSKLECEVHEKAGSYEVFVDGKLDLKIEVCKIRTRADHL